MTRSQAQLTREGFAELADAAGFSSAFLDGGACPQMGARLSNPALVRTFRRLAEAGLDDFYRGGLAADIAADLGRAGAPIRAADLGEHRSWAARLSIGPVANPILFHSSRAIERRASASAGSFTGLSINRHGCVLRHEK